jgi:hypothetical protein
MYSLEVVAVVANWKSNAQVVLLYVRVDVWLSGHCAGVTDSNLTLFCCDVFSCVYVVVVVARAAAEANDL